MEHPRIAVLGAGANGTVVGTDLSRAGHDVTLIDQWPENVRAITENGAIVECGETRTVTRLPAMGLAEVAAMRAPFDVVFLLVKAYDTRWACELITPLLHDGSVVVGVQNGMTLEAISGVVGPERAIGAVIEITSAMYEPGIAQRHSEKTRSWFALGTPDPHAALRLPLVERLLGEVGIVETTDDILSAKWMKLVLNAAELVPSAILDLSIAECARFTGMRDVMIEAGVEALRAAEVLGYATRPIFGMPPYGGSDPGGLVAAVLDELLAHYVLPHSRATVLQDWMKGRRSEVLEINGAVVDALESAGLPAPVNATVVEYAREIEAGTRHRGIHNATGLVEGRGRR